MVRRTLTETKTAEGGVILDRSFAVEFGPSMAAFTVQREDRPALSDVGDRLPRSRRDLNSCERAVRRRGCEEEREP